MAGIEEIKIISVSESVSQHKQYQKQMVQWLHPGKKLKSLTTQKEASIMTNGTYTDLSSHTVTVTATNNGYMPTYADGEVVFV